MSGHADFQCASSCLSGFPSSSPPALLPCTPCHMAQLRALQTDSLLQIYRMNCMKIYTHPSAEFCLYICALGARLARCYLHLLSSWLGLNTTTFPPCVWTWWSFMRRETKRHAETCLGCNKHMTCACRDCFGDKTVKLHTARIQWFDQQIWRETDSMQSMCLTPQRNCLQNCIAVCAKTIKDWPVCSIYWKYLYRRSSEDYIILRVYAA